MRLVQELGYCYHYEVAQDDANAWFWQIATSGHDHVPLLQERIVDDVDDPVGALHVRPIHIDLLVVPDDHVACKRMGKSC